MADHKWLAHQAYLTFILVSDVCYVDKHNSTRIGEGRKVRNYSRDKDEGAYHGGEGGEEPAGLVTDPESELLLGREKKEKGKVQKDNIEWNERKK